MNTSRRYREIASEFAGELRRLAGVPIRAVLLYGSVARGEATEGSDIDLLVVYDEARPTFGESHLNLAARFVDKYGTLLSVLDCSPEEYERILRFPFGWQLRKEAIRL